MLRVFALLLALAGWMAMIVPSGAQGAGKPSKTCQGCGVVVDIAHEPYGDSKGAGLGSTTAITGMQQAEEAPWGYDLVVQLDNGPTIILHHRDRDGLEEGARVRVIQGQAYLL